jgi:hypothetical protein
MPRYFTTIDLMHRLLRGLLKSDSRTFKSSPESRIFTISAGWINLPDSRNCFLCWKKRLWVLLRQGLNHAAKDSTPC